MKTTITSPSGSPGPRYPFPCRPHPAESYRPLAALPKLVCVALSAGGVEMIEFHLTTRLSDRRWADTFSHGTVELRDGRRLGICTTFSKGGVLLLEAEKGQTLSAGIVADIARAVREGHIREQARQYVRRGRN